MYLKRIQETFKSFNNGKTVIATGKFSLWNVALLSRFKRINTIAIIHGSEVNFKSFVLRKSIDYALKRMDKIIAVSQYTKSLIAHLQIESYVIPNGIDVKEWGHPITENSAFSGDPVITTVGRVSSRKGQLNVIRHLPEIIKYFPKIHYHCVGIPTEAKEFMKEAEEIGVGQHVTFHGSVDFESLKTNLMRTDISLCSVRKQRMEMLRALELPFWRQMH